MRFHCANDLVVLRYEHWLYPNQKYFVKKEESTVDTEGEMFKEQRSVSYLLRFLYKRQ